MTVSLGLVGDTHYFCRSQRRQCGILMGSPQGVQRESGQIVEMSVDFDNSVQMSVPAAELRVTIFLVF